jgi:hypothetical protein
VHHGGYHICYPLQYDTLYIKSTTSETRPTIHQ